MGSLGDRCGRAFDLPLAVCRKRTGLLGAIHGLLLDVAVIGNPNHVKTQSL